MKQFFKFFFASFLAIFLFNAVIILVAIGIITAAVVNKATKSTEITENSILHLKLNKRITERGKKDPFSAIFGSSDRDATGLNDIKEAILKASNDANIKGIDLECNYVSTGYASLEEIRDALIAFKKKGKFITCYSEMYSEGGYYMASVADEIYLNPNGELEFNGLASVIPFFKGALEKLEVKPEIFRVGTYKSAVEPFMLDKMSDANRLQTTSFLGNLYDHYLSKVSASRNIDVKTLRLVSDSMLVRNAQGALKYKLITSLGYEDQYNDMLRKRLKLKKDDKISRTTVTKILDADEDENDGEDSKDKESKKEYAKDRIAVIICSGEINSGKSGEDNIGSETIAEAIKTAREAKNVKAIVLRINSPGGSALASDVMWREVKLCKGVKPVVASMGDVAASGGYYLAMACDSIIAHPNTITGSIGVFGLFFTAEGLLKNKLGVTFDRVKTGQFSDFGSADRGLTDPERRIIQRGVEEIYESFTTKAAEGRHMAVDSLKKVASGRVWTGNQALKIGLVDRLGSMEDAIDVAARMAKIKKDSYRLRYYPALKTPIEQIKEAFGAEARAAIVKAEIGSMYPLLKQAQRLQRMEGVQALLPFTLDVK